MTQKKTEVVNLLFEYFKQQKELYGDGFVFSQDEFDSFKKSLENRPSKLIEEPKRKPVINKKNDIQFESGNLQQFNEQIKDCQKCSLGKTRISFVFGIGNPNADIMLIGEAPGAEEDKKGEPFVGRAGQLLNKILKSIDFQREEVFIANILKCRPPGNRDPLAEEVAQCEPYLHQQIKLIQPKVILSLGRISGQTLLQTKSSLTGLRGKLHNYQGIPMIVTFYPAALLRNPQWKYPTWDDVRYLRKVIDAINKGEDPNSVAFEQTNH
jgi:uracil-DNA glycosylase